MSIILSARSVDGYYGTIQSLHQINLEVEEGKITSVLGANGSGKTTLFRALCGLIWVKGKIVFLERRIDFRLTETIARMGLVQVPQGRGTFKDLTVEENLRLGALIRKDRRTVQADMTKIYDYFPILARRRKQLAGKLSGGEQQMLALGRGLLMKPKMLLLDEPSIGLAPLIVEDIFKFIRAINKHEKVTILLSEQNATLAMEISSKVYLLETGRIVFTGNPETLRQDDSLRRAYLG